MQKVVIIGGVAGGMSAAARLRRRDEQAEIVVLEQGPHISFANCGLPYHIGGKITERDALLVQTPEAFRQRFRVDVRVLSRALKVDPKAKTVTVHDLENDKTYDESYDKLILSPGANPLKPPLEGIDLPGIFSLRNIPDTDAINAYLDEHKPKVALIIGAGYIGLEMAENLRHRGIKAHIVEMAPHVMPLMDHEMAAMVEQELAQQQVTFSLNSKVVGFRQAEHGLQVSLENGETLEGDLAILALGVRPNSELAQQAGLEIGERGGIKVDAHLQTSDADIYAIGDAIEIPYLPTGESVPIALAGPANKQGRLVADNLVDGNQHVYRGSVGTAILKVFDLDVALTGLSSEQLNRRQIPHRSVIVHPNHHAGYYPGAKPLSLKLTFGPEDGKLLGGQVVGYEGVDKRIDVLSIGLQQGWTVDDLTEFEQAYAPPYSSAKDPINILGFAAQNVLLDQIDTVEWHQLKSAQAEGAQLLDVRTAEEVEVHALAGAIHIPLDELRERLEELDPTKPVITFCRVGQRGYLAARLLKQRGFEDVRNLVGGLLTYETATGKASEAAQFDERYDTGMQPIAQAEPTTAAQVIDACGLQCPGPIMRLKDAFDQVGQGDVVEIKATDPGFYKDVQAWAQATGTEVVELNKSEGVITARLRKRHHKPVSSQITVHDNAKTIIVFDDDLDRLIASFIIANGALSMGREVTMFFTFWGLSALRKEHPTEHPHKNPVEKMFGVMLPKGSKHLHLSRMDFGGMGAEMIRRIMQAKHIDSLEDMIQHAMQQGVHIVACRMSMDMMGIKEEELIDGIEYAGVAEYLAQAEHADTNLFI